MSLQNDAKQSAFKKPGQIVHRQNLVQHDSSNKSNLLHINTSNRAESALSLVSPASSTASSKAKGEIKFTKEIKRLEALCESRTKELSLMKITLKESLIAFDAMAVAFNYLSNDLDGFESTKLKAKVLSEKKNMV